MAGVYVPGRGPLHAKLVVLGEAPGRQEEEHLRLFVGPSGHLQDGYMRRVGIDPSQVRYENVYPMRPPGKDGNILSVPREELQAWQEDCLSRLDQLSSVVLIVPVGNTALQTLTGLQQISLRRGSVYQWKNVYGREVKVIPTIHPAAILREPTLEYRTVKDWERIAREVKRGSQVHYPERQFVLDPPQESIEEWVRAAYDPALLTPLSLDIETNPAQKQILCVGFAFGSGTGMSLSWTKKYKGYIKALCESPCAKLLQNGLYDLYWLRMHGFEVKNYQYDCLALHHLLHPNEKHSLAFTTSIFTDEPYYKGSDDPDEEKVWEKGDWYQLLEYNARDAMVEYEVGWERLWELVKEKGWEDRYFEGYQCLFEPLLDLMTHGVRVNQDVMKEQYACHIRDSKDAQRQAEALCGFDLFTLTGKGRQALYRRLRGETGEDIDKAISRLRKPLAEIQAEIEALGVSDTVLKNLLYTRWKLPVQKDRKTGSVTVDENALRKLLQKVEKRGEETQAQFLRAVLTYRNKRKLAEFFDPTRVDADGRMRCEYSYNTRPGRLASKRNPMGTGANLQNISRKARAIFLPDPGCVMCEVDLSQIQARFVYVMAYQVTGDESLLRLAQMKPCDGDIHTESAAQMFHVPLEQVSKEQRYKGKVTEHASNFGLAADHLQEVFLKGDEGIAVSLQECQELLRRKFESRPGILAWQRAIREEILRTGKLVSAWGSEIDFTYERKGEELWRKAYAWKPQTDEARHLNRLGLVPTWRYLRERGYRSKINLQCHDELVFSLRAEEAYDVVQFCVESLEQEREYYGVRLSIPCSVKIGMSWEGTHEWKQLPGEQEFQEKMEEVMHERSQATVTNGARAK